METFTSYQRFGFGIVSPKAILPGPITSGDEPISSKKEFEEERQRILYIFRNAEIGKRIFVNDTDRYFQVRRAKNGNRVYRFHIVGGKYTWIDDKNLEGIFKPRR